MIYIPGLYVFRIILYQDLCTYLITIFDVRAAWSLATLTM